MKEKKFIHTSVNMVEMYLRRVSESEVKEKYTFAKKKKK